MKIERQGVLKKCIFCILCVTFLSGCQIRIGGTAHESQIIDDHTFIDDMGNLIEVHRVAETIVSLSSMHTENLYFLDRGKAIIGMDKGSNFPYDTINTVHYDLSNDYQLNQLIESDPDLILITPDMNHSQTGLVSVLEASCRKVVSLKPNELWEFDAYITKLSMLTGSQEKALELLKDYHNDLDGIEYKIEEMFQANESMASPVVFVEAAERGYETVYEGSPVDEALQLIQVDQLLEDNQQPYDLAMTVPFGMDKLLENGERIDVYFTLQGRSGDGSSTIIIDQKEEMQGIRAVREGHLYDLLVPLIDNYTFRYPVGVRGLARQVYGQAFEPFEIKAYASHEALTRGEMANLVYHYEGLQPFTIIDDDYYAFEKFHHTFGSFVDVNWDDPDFHQIEALVMRAYIYPIKHMDPETNEVIESFQREKKVTRSEMAKFIHTKLELETAVTHEAIRDIENHEDAKIIQKVVDSGYMNLEDSKFRPNDQVTVDEFITLLMKIDDRGNDE